MAKEKLSESLEAVEIKLAKIGAEPTHREKLQQEFDRLKLAFGSKYDDKRLLIIAAMGVGVAITIALAAKKIREQEQQSPESENP